MEKIFVLAVAISFSLSHRKSELKFFICSHGNQYLLCVVEDQSDEVFGS